MERADSALLPSESGYLFSPPIFTSILNNSASALPIYETGPFLKELLLSER